MIAGCQAGQPQLDGSSEVLSFTNEPFDVRRVDQDRFSPELRPNDLKQEVGLAITKDADGAAFTTMPRSASPLAGS